MPASSDLPVLGAALTSKTLALHRGWILERQRDLEIQDFFQAESLDGDWRGAVGEIRAAARTATRPARHPRTVLGLQDRQPGPADPRGRDQAPAAGARGLRSPRRDADGDPFALHDLGSTTISTSNPGARDNLVERVHATLGGRRQARRKYRLRARHREHRGQGSAATACGLRKASNSRRSASRSTPATPTTRTSPPARRRSISTSSAAGDTLAHVHLQDTDGYADRHWAPGEGNISLARGVSRAGPADVKAAADHRGAQPSHAVRAGAAHLAALGLAESDARQSHGVNTICLIEPTEKSMTRPSRRRSSASAPPQPARCCCRASRSARPTTGRRSRSPCRRSPIPTRSTCCASSPTSASACSSPRSGKADHQELARQPGGRAGPRHRMAPHRRPDRRAEAAPGRQVPQWRRADGRRRRVQLQPRAHVRQDRGQEPRDHPGVRTASRRRAPARSCRRKFRRSPVASGRISSASMPSTNTRCVSYNATPDVTLEGRLSRYGSDIMSRRGWEEAASYLDWARKPITTGPYKVVELQARRVADARSA